MNLPPIDFAAIVAGADLRRLVEADLGAPHRGKQWRCPFHADTNPSMGLDRAGRRFKCWSCGAAGDAIDWLARRESITTVEAARRLGGLGDDRPARKSSPSRPAPPPKDAPAWHNPSWQAAVDELVQRAEADLWDADGRDALDWVRRRGLDDSTIRRFRLGWLPEEGWTRPATWPDGRVSGLHYERGILYPWAAPGGWYGRDHGGLPSPDRRWVGANVRRLMPDLWEPWDGPSKYKALGGSERGHGYPFADLTPGVVAVIVEGEPDALLGWQEFGWVVNVVTVGGAKQTPRPEVLDALDACPAWLIATDHDPAGNEAARDWLRRAPAKSHRLFMRGWKDLGALVDAGESPLDWLRGEFARLGWRWPLRSPMVPPE